MYKTVTIKFPYEIYRELQFVKKYYGKERWRDQDFIRWLIHTLYNNIQDKLLSEYEERFK